MRPTVLVGRMAIVAAVLCGAVFAAQARAGGSLRTFGACCVRDRTCNNGFLDTTCEDTLGGVFLGVESQCAAPEACCLPDGTCRDLDPLCCQAKECDGGFNAGNICLVDGDCEDGADDGICNPLLVGTSQGAGSVCGVQCCTDADCDDSEACTLDVCDASAPNADPVTGCVNEPLPVDTPCEADDFLCTIDQCDGTGQCVPNDVECPPDDDCQVFACNPATGQCDSEPINEGLPCDGPPMGDCDLQDICVEGTCQENVEPAGTVCRTLMGACDVEDVCDGSSKECVDDVLPSDTICRTAVGDCDIAEACPGDSPDCPPDGFQPSEVVCREEAEGELCDAAEFCTGASRDCPDDGFKQDGTVCREAAGDCDVEEACSGESPDCPSDGFASPGTTCRMADGECDREERCTGEAADCPPDECKPAGASCADDGDECTDDSCDGACACTHTNNNRCGACCLPDTSCIDGVLRLTCIAADGSFASAGTFCSGDVDADGVVDLCDLCPGVSDVTFGFGMCDVSMIECDTNKDCPLGESCEPACRKIPTVSEWGLVVLALLLLAAGKVYFGFPNPKTRSPTPS